MDSAAEATDGAETASGSAGAPAFGDGDLGRLQNILLGDHARQTLDRIDTLEQALLGAIDDLRTEMQQRTDDLSSRIDAEADTRSTAVGNMGSRVDEEVAERASALKELTADLRSTEKDLHQALDAASDTASSAVDELRETTERLAATDDELGSAKVDRLQLAELLSAAAAGLDASPE